MNQKQFVDYYKTLQVDPDAEPEVVEAAYKRLARKYHPDLNPSSNATARMQEINAAYEALRDPTGRAEYHMHWERACARVHPATAPDRPPAWWPGPPPTVTFCPSAVEFADADHGEVLRAEVEVSLSGKGRFRGDMQPNQGWIRTRVARRRRDSLVIEVMVDTANLRGGVSYQGSVVFSSPVLGAVLLPVRVSVRPEPRPLVRVRPDWLDAGRRQRSEGQVTLELGISNAGSGELEGEVHVKHAWLAVDPDHFAGDAQIKVRVNIAALKPGRAYTGKLEVSSNGGLAIVPVKLEVAHELPFLPPEDSDEYLPTVLSLLRPKQAWQRDLVETVTLQSRQRGWRPTTQQQALIRRILEESREG